MNRFFLLVFCTALLGACAPHSMDSVFPESDSDKLQNQDCSSDVLPQQFIVKWNSGEQTVETEANAEAFKQNFLTQHLTEVQHVEFDRIIHVSQSSATTDIESRDPYWGMKMIEAQAAWNQGYHGEGINVGIVDTAVDITQAQLADQVLVNQAELNGIAGVDDDQNGYIDDVMGWDFFKNAPGPSNVVSTNVHGTHVSGIVAADSTKGNAMGVAPGAHIIPASFMGDDGRGYLSAAVLAMRYAAQRGANIINASWGGDLCSQSMKDEISDLNTKGVLFMVAAGNDGASLDQTPEFPASIVSPNQITVAASMASDRLASYSNTSYNFVNLAAPGDNIFSTTPTGGDYLSGTSMATPFVSGAAAVVWSVRPRATYLQVKQALLDSVDVKGFRVSTRGRLNLRKAVDAIKQLVP